MGTASHGLRLPHTTSPAVWALGAGLAAALRAGLIVGLMFGSLSSERGLPAPLIAAGSALIVTLAVDYALLQGAGQPLWKVGAAIFGVICATLPHLLFWIVLWPPRSSFFSFPIGLVLGLVLVGPFTIPASIISTIALVRRYRRAIGASDTRPSEPIVEEGMRVCPGCGMANMLSRRRCNRCGRQLADDLPRG